MRRTALSFAVTLACAGSANAGRPLNTDNAGILPEGACQLEAWLRPSAHLDQAVVQPACNPWGGVEWGLSLVRQHSPGAATQSQLGVRGKATLKELAPGSWGAGASFGASRQVEGGSTGTLRYGTLIFSAAPSQPLALHFNLGATQMASASARATWAAAIEHAVGERWTLVAEAYGERHGRPAQQFGARTWLRPESLQLDATIGRETLDGQREHFVTVGLVWVWDKACARP